MLTASTTTVGETFIIKPSLCRSLRCSLVHSFVSGCISVHWQACVCGCMCVYCPHVCSLAHLCLCPFTVSHCTQAHVKLLCLLWLGMIWQLKDARCYFSPFSKLSHILSLSQQKHELLLRASVNCLSSLLGFLQRRTPATGTRENSLLISINEYMREKKTEKACMLAFYVNMFKNGCVLATMWVCNMCASIYCGCVYHDSLSYYLCLQHCNMHALFLHSGRIY